MEIRMLTRFLLIFFLLTTKAFADTVLVKDGTQYTGIIIEITDQTVVLRAGGKTLTLLRTSTREIVFAKSDLVVLASGDTLRGKVLGRDENGLVVALQNGLRTIQTTGVTEIVYS